MGGDRYFFSLVVVGSGALCTCQLIPKLILLKIAGELKVGDCFGTLKKLEGRAANSRILSVVTKEPNCEFLKISTSDFTSVQEQVEKSNISGGKSVKLGWGMCLKHNHYK